VGSLNFPSHNKKKSFDLILMAPLHGTNYPPEFLYQAMVAKHKVQQWGDFD